MQGSILGDHAFNVFAGNIDTIHRIARHQLVYSIVETLLDCGLFFCRKLRRRRRRRRFLLCLLLLMRRKGATRHRGLTIDRSKLPHDPVHFILLGSRRRILGVLEHAASGLVDDLIRRRDASGLLLISAGDLIARLFRQAILYSRL